MKEYLGGLSAIASRRWADITLRMWRTSARRSPPERREDLQVVNFVEILSTSGKIVEEGILHIERVNPRYLMGKVVTGQESAMPISSETGVVHWMGVEVHLAKLVYRPETIPKMRRSLWINSAFDGLS